MVDKHICKVVFLEITLTSFYDFTKVTGEDFTLVFISAAIKLFIMASSIFGKI